MFVDLNYVMIEELPHEEDGVKAVTEAIECHEEERLQLKYYTSGLTRKYEGLLTTEIDISEEENEYLFW